MTKTLELSEFIRLNVLDDIIIIEGYDWSDEPEANRLGARLTTQAELDAKASEQAQQGAIVKQALVDFVTQQLPNIKLQSNRMSLGDMTLRNGGDLTSTINKPELKPWFHMLCASVRGFLQGQDQKKVVSLLKPFGGNIVQLVNSIAPEVTQKIQHGNTQNGIN